MVAICDKCAKDKGLIPKDKAVGMWTAECGTCGVEQVVCAEERDYTYPGQRKVTLEDVLICEANNPDRE